MTTASLVLWAILAGPVPDYYGVPSWPQSYDPILNHWADANLVPRSLARAMVAAESGFRPGAVAYQWEEVRGRWRSTSKVLAHGLAMVTANPEHLGEHLARAGLRPEGYDWRDASDSLRVGMAYLGSLLRYFDYEVRPSVAGYNCGRSRAAAWWCGDRSLPRETIKYMKEVLR